MGGSHARRVPFMQAAKGEKTKIQVPLQDGTTKTVELEIPAGASCPERPRPCTMRLKGFTPL